MTQEQAFSIMKTGVNIYLTGSAGSGKTFLLNKYINYLESHNIPVAVTASTGIAATHMNGMTIHSWSGIGVKNYLDEKELEHLEDKKYLWKRFEKARVLIIDEVSMLHASQLDMVERVCRRFKRNDKPFGGLQVILSGDFFQLPPVNKREEENESGMIFNSKAWLILNPAVCYIEEQHRQEDNELTDILNTIRNNKIDEKHLEILQSRIGANLGENIKPTKLYTHNINVDDINNIELGGIQSDEVTFQMTSSGPEPLVDILKKSCLAHEQLRLKVGAEIMCVKNNFEQGYVNGSRGRVIGFEEEDNSPIIELYNGRKVSLGKELWAIEEDGKIKASVSQIPLRLAWAITIHKSQGMSLDNAEIDLGSTFTYGMGYVALSRVRTLKGISLVRFNRDALRVDPKVLEFDQELKNQSFSNELLFKKLDKEGQSKLEKDFIERMGGTLYEEKKKGKKINIKDTKIPTIEITKKLLEEGRSIKEIAKERNYTAETIVNHLEQIISKFPEIIITHIRPSQKDINLVKKANNKLKGDNKGKLGPIKSILEKEGHNMSWLDIRIAKLFI
ncbi:MAG TPA: AAA family ATPase [Candidatus Paceibacterota bacterium]|nr:AAA family ATPase [Candidatus Paceibacterota bacterium]